MWDLNKDYGFSTSVTDFPGTDFRTDWNTIGDYSGLSGKPYDSGSSWSGDDKWKDALSKGISWLASGKNKYRSQAERQQGGVGFMPRSGGGGGGQFQQVAPDISVFMPQQQAPFTIQAPKSSGGIGSTIGGALGTVGGALIGGPFGAQIGGSAGSAIGGLFG
jgi:hypothetical protein